MSIYRERQQFDRAARLLRDLCGEFPDDTNLAAAFVQVISLQASDAAARNQPDAERVLSDQAASMIREFRGRFPNNPLFLQAECDMVARRGDFPARSSSRVSSTRHRRPHQWGPSCGRDCTPRWANRPTWRMPTAKRSSGAVLRQLELRVLLGQTRLKLGQVDEALRQAKLVLDVDKNRTDALLLQARALAKSGKTPADPAAGQQAAIVQLQAAIKANPRFEEAYHVLAEIHRDRQDRSRAITVLKDDLKANPTDATAVASLVEILAQSNPGGSPSTAADLDEAKRLGGEIAARDRKGQMVLALAIGFNRRRGSLTWRCLTRRSPPRSSTPRPPI